MERLDFDHSEVISYLQRKISTRIANKQLRTFSLDSFSRSQLVFHVGVKCLVNCREMNLQFEHFHYFMFELLSHS